MGFPRIFKGENVMTKNGFSIRFPKIGSRTLSQDEEYFLLENDGKQQQIRFHDYHQIYSTPGLYEYLFYEKLSCNSPRTVRSLLEKEVKKTEGDPSRLSVLDIGAGNGMVGEQLADMGVKSIVGVDIIEEAAQAARRDRPGIYEDYFVADLTSLSSSTKKELEEKEFNCLTSVAALGFNDIPPQAFGEGFNLVAKNGWIAFNIKDVFLDENDRFGFSGMLDRMIQDGIFTVKAQQRYCHRFSMEGDPLYYIATVGTKQCNIPLDLMREYS